jgi:hypothetical protein
VSDLKPLHDEDFLAWSKEQAEALRAAATAGSSESDARSRPLRYRSIASSRAGALARANIRASKILDDSADLAIQRGLLSGAQVFDLLGEIFPIEGEV